MDARRALEKRIEKETQMIADLQIQIERAESFVRGLEEALSMLPKEKEPKRGKSKLKGKLRSGSEVEKAYNFLRQNASPMHISDILIAIGKENTKANRMSLVGSLGRYSRKGQFFSRVGPNIFTLKEFANTRAKMSLDLPEEFGR